MKPKEWRGASSWLFPEMLFWDFVIQVRYRHDTKGVFQFRLGTETYFRCHNIGTYNDDTRQVYQVSQKSVHLCNDLPSCKRILFGTPCTWQSIFCPLKGGGWVVLSLSGQIHYFLYPSLNFLSTCLCFLFSRVISAY